MPRNVILAGLLTLSLVSGVVAILASPGHVQKPQQGTGVPLTALALSSTPSPTNTDEPPTSTFRPTLTDQQLSLTRPGPAATRTPRVGPTITPSGPSLATSSDDVKRLFHNLPKTLSTFPLNAPSAIGETTVIFLTVTGMDGIEYPMELQFTSSDDEAHVGFLIIASHIVDSQQVNIGDEAVVTLHEDLILATMRYRNVLVYIRLPDPKTDSTPRTLIPPTRRQLIAILKDLYQYLAQQ